MAARGGRRFASGFATRRRSGKPKTKVGQLLYDYWQPGLHNQDLNALANGADTGITLMDNSADFGNSIVTFRKLTLRWHWHGADMTNFAADELLVALTKQDEDDTGTYPSLDSEEVVRELRRDNKMVRGPWIITTPNRVGGGSFTPHMALLMKPIVLKNLVLGPEEDLLVSFTNLSNAVLPSSSQLIRFFPMGYARKQAV